MLRGVLSRPIERLILLDRLLFAREAGLSEAYAQEVFDPLVSPRCYAIVATSRAAGGEPESTARESMCVECT